MSREKTTPSRIRWPRRPLPKGGGRVPSGETGIHWVGGGVTQLAISSRGSRPTFTTYRAVFTNSFLRGQNTGRSWGCWCPGQGLHWGFAVDVNYLLKGRPSFSLGYAARNGRPAIRILAPGASRTAAVPGPKSFSFGTPISFPACNLRAVDLPRGDLRNISVDYYRAGVRNELEAAPKSAIRPVCHLFPLKEGWWDQVGLWRPISSLNTRGVGN